MGAINTNKLRVGNITSSEIYHLMGNPTAAAIKTGETFSKPALTYIQERNFERKLGRSLSDEVTARPLSWGKLIERRCFDVLGLEYKLCSQETLQHPKIDYFAGSPDAEKFGEEKTVVELKCPLTLKSFCQLVEEPNINAIRENHKDGEKYYWQCVANSVLTESQFAELIIYCPYKSELQEIRDMASNTDSMDQYKYFWIANATDEELPYLVDGGNYKNVNVIKFEVPKEDKTKLLIRIMEAGKHLIQRQ